jgi:hypothetical protein
MFFLVTTFSVYIITTFAVRCWERGSAFKVLSHEMILMDIAIQFFAVASMVCYISSEYYFPNLDYVANHNSYGGSDWPIAESCAMWQNARNLMGVAVIMQWLRLIEYLAILPDVGVVPRAMLHTLRTVGLFGITLVVILVAFSTGFVVVYSSSTTKFDNYSNAIVTLWSALLGNVEVDDFIKTSYVTGIFLFLFFTFFTLFVFLNMLIAVILEGYNTAKEEEKAIELSIVDASNGGVAATKCLPKLAAACQRPLAYFDHFAANQIGAHFETP